MDWIKKLLPKDDEELERREVFSGTLEQTDEDMQRAIHTIMQYALNAPGGGGVRDVGEKMNLEMIGVEVGVMQKGKQVATKQIGDYRITVERIA